MKKNDGVGGPAGSWLGRLLSWRVDTEVEPAMLWSGKRDKKEGTEAYFLKNRLARGTEEKELESMYGGLDEQHLCGGVGGRSTVWDNRW